MKQSQFYAEGYDVGRGHAEGQNEYLAGSYAWEEWNNGYTDGIIDAEQAQAFYEHVDEQVVDYDRGEIGSWGQPPIDTTIRVK